MDFKIHTTKHPSINVIINKFHLIHSSTIIFYLDAQRIFWQNIYLSPIAVWKTGQPNITPIAPHLCYIWTIKNHLDDREHFQWYDKTYPLYEKKINLLTVPPYAGAMDLQPSKPRLDSSTHAVITFEIMSFQHIIGQPFHFFYCI